MTLKSNQQRNNHIFYQEAELCVKFCLSAGTALTRPEYQGRIAYLQDHEVLDGSTLPFVLVVAERGSSQ